MTCAASGSKKIHGILGNLEVTHDRIIVIIISNIMHWYIRSVNEFVCG